MQRKISKIKMEKTKQHIQSLEQLCARQIKQIDCDSVKMYLVSQIRWHLGRDPH